MSIEAMKEAIEALEQYSGVNQRACDAEESLRQAIKQAERVVIRHWLQETIETGRWVQTEPMSRHVAEKAIADHWFERGEIVFDIDWEAIAADQAMTIAMMKAEQPICPHCKTKMTPVNDLSDYSPSAYWQCKCESLPNAEIDYGKYGGC